MAVFGGSVGFWWPELPIPFLQVPAGMAELWNHKSAQQKAVIRLCEAAANGNNEAIKVCTGCTEPHLLNDQ